MAKYITLCQNHWASFNGQLPPVGISLDKINRVFFFTPFFHQSSRSVSPPFPESFAHLAIPTHPPGPFNCSLCVFSFQRPQPTTWLLCSITLLYTNALFFNDRYVLLILSSLYFPPVQRNCCGFLILIFQVIFFFNSPSSSFEGPTSIVNVSLPFFSLFPALHLFHEPPSGNFFSPPFFFTTLNKVQESVTGKAFSIVNLSALWVRSPPPLRKPFLSLPGLASTYI